MMVRENDRFDQRELSAQRTATDRGDQRELRVRRTAADRGAQRPNEVRRQDEKDSGYRI